jgi:hypothetical protein
MAAGVVVGDGGLPRAWARPKKGICGMASRRPGWQCAASCGGRRVFDSGVVLRLGRRRRRVVMTATTVVGCSLRHGGMVGAPAAWTCDFGKKLLQWRCGSASEMSLDWSGRGDDAGSCAMRAQQGSVALG